MTDPTPLAELRERVAKAICLAQPRDSQWIWEAVPSGIRDIYRSDADAVLAAIGLEVVARLREYPLGTGAEWTDTDGQKIEHDENPHRIPDGTLLYRIAPAAPGGDE